MASHKNNCVKSENCTPAIPPSTKKKTFEGTPGLTGSVLWDKGVVLGKFLEHAIESRTILLQGKKVVELGSSCGLVGCIVALLGAEVILIDLPDRLRLLRKNVGTNLYGNVHGSTTLS
ncbi:EEF1A lysine methyltransferase 3 [Camellia lanceoleosa]|uniref:EEF1A lysine methyltransferase 3 n=1 Tax=Camellia lanceoleosa TaxID=1840588 RepID=A0ACC0FZ88_9ERIC|nr:EEF1A lysine methyltransferase 3 [Camellia lanceoleosa]